MPIRSKLGGTKDRAEGMLSASAPALSEAQLVPGVQHLMNLTIPYEQVKFHIGCLRLEAV